MARKSTSAGLITFGIINIVVALMPVCAGCFGITMNFTEPKMIINNREVGREFAQHIDRTVPGAKAEAVAALLANGLFCLLLIGGGIGLFLAQNWARWLTIGASLLLVLTLCVHDIYQLAVYRPAVMQFLDGQLPPGPEREGFKFGFGASWFLWNCANPLVMIYLFAMCVCLSLSSAFSPGPDAAPRRRRDADDEEDDDEDDRRRKRRKQRD